MRISFVCTGNICRSPTAEVVMRQLVRIAGLEGELEVESSGLSDYHVGDGADRRSLKTLQARGYDGSSHQARQFSPSDFDRLDLVIALDGGHLRDLRRMAASDTQRAKLRLLGSYSEQDARDPDVPDPYYGGPSGFDDVIDRIERACSGLLTELQSGVLRSR